MVSSSAELSAAVAKAQTLGDGVLIERFILGREVQMSILGGRALPSIEIRSVRRVLRLPQQVPPRRRRGDHPRRHPAGDRGAACARGSYGVQYPRPKVVARADFILDGEDRLWFLEINTLPGMTPTSLAPQEAAAAGLSYEQLCQKIIDLALEEDKT